MAAQGRRATRLSVQKQEASVKIQEESFGQKVQKKYDMGIDAQLAMAEQISFGVLDGASFLGSADCVAAMEGVVYYGFEVLAYREVYDPRNTMKAVIYAQKLSEQVTLFYA